jgi:hypothetical protein
VQSAVTERPVDVVLSLTKLKCGRCRSSIILPPEIYTPYILESNPHPFYSFRGLKNQMRIRIECGLDSRSRTGFWKNDRAGVLTFFRLRRPQKTRCRLNSGAD